MASTEVEKASPSEDAVSEEDTDVVSSLPQTHLSEVEKAKFKAIRGRGRRSSVSAECYTPGDAVKPFIFKVVSKTQEEEQRIHKAIGDSFLFSGCDEEQKKKVYGAMVEKKAAKGEDIIVQGQEGDFFYVLDEGSCDVFVDDKKVHHYEAGNSFGELALMYNCPRAAKVQAIESCTLWALDRETFRHILTSGQSEKKLRHENFLKQCSLFQNLSQEELSKISDVLAEQHFSAGNTIIKEGDAELKEMRFYIIEKGTAEATKTKDGDDKLVGTMTEGQFFGEKALVEKVARAATVTAKTDVKTACLDVAAFERLMGPCSEILQRTIENYTAAGTGLQAARNLSSDQDRKAEVIDTATKVT